MGVLLGHDGAPLPLQLTCLCCGMCEEHRSGEANLRQGHLKPQALLAAGVAGPCKQRALPSISAVPGLELGPGFLSPNAPSQVFLAARLYTILDRQPALKMLET